MPKAFQPFAEAVLKSDGLHVVTPEFNGGMPGNLKYFINMLKFSEPEQFSIKRFSSRMNTDLGMEIEAKTKHQKVKVPKLPLK